MMNDDINTVFADVKPEELLLRAREAADLSYVPYSKFHVGAAMLFEDGRVIKAGNVENASFGLTICAERAAVCVMMSQGLRKPAAIAVVGSAEDRDDYMSVPCPPCGACRQVLMEFNPNMLLVLADAGGHKIFPIHEMLPHSFSLKS